MTLLAAGTSPHATGVGDFDGDGRPDIVASASTGNDVSVFLNTSQ